MWDIVNICRIYTCIHKKNKIHEINFNEVTSISLASCISISITHSGTLFYKKFSAEIYPTSSLGIITHYQSGISFLPAFSKAQNKNG